MHIILFAAFTLSSQKGIIFFLILKTIADLITHQFQHRETKGLVNPKYTKNIFNSFEKLIKNAGDLSKIQKLNQQKPY